VRVLYKTLRAGFMYHN